MHLGIGSLLLKGAHFRQGTRVRSDGSAAAHQVHLPLLRPQRSRLRRDPRATGRDRRDVLYQRLCASVSQLRSSIALVAGHAHVVAALDLTLLEFHLIFLTSLDSLNFATLTSFKRVLLLVIPLSNCFSLRASIRYKCYIGICLTFVVNLDVSVSENKLKCVCWLTCSSDCCHC